MLLVASLLASPASAQKAPDAGTILRDFGGGGTLAPAPVLPPEAPAPAKPPSDTAGARVRVSAFHIRATQFPEATLQDVLKDYVGRELTIGELREAAFRLSEYYRQHDVLGRAILPRQTIRDGVVEIVVIEAKLGSVRVDPSTKTRLDPDIATGMIEHRAKPGEILRPSQLQEGVAIVNEIPGVAATATLRPGATEAETIADLQIKDTPLVTGFVEGDNHSSHYIGSRRALGLLNLHDPFGRGEQAQLLGLKSQSSYFVRGALQAPIGTSGLTLGINQSYLDFDIGGPFKALKQGGYAYTTGGTAAYPVRRSPDFALTGLLTYDHKRIVDKSLGTDTDYRALDVGTVGVTSTLIDQLWGGGLNDFGARLTFGNLDRSGNQTDFASDKLTARTNGAYAKLNLNASRVQKIVERTDFYVSGSGQVSNKNLDSSEKFSLGGPYGVRAYPVNEGNGDEGFLGTAELRHRLPHGLAVFALYDFGVIRVNHHAWDGWQPVAGEPNHYFLQGAGVGISWVPTPAVQIKLTYAHTLGANPGQDANGNNADGQHTRRQFWAVGRIVF